MAIEAENNPFLRNMRRRPTLGQFKMPGLDDGPQFSTQPDPGLLSQIGGAATSGLSAVGNFLDIPASVARDTAAYFSGDQNANPFDQLLPWNWGTDQHRTSGRDLNRLWGAAGPEDTYANWWGGLGTEIALDPLTYLTFGASAATKAGKVAQAAGMLGDIGKAAGTAGNLSGRLSGTLNHLARHGGPEATEALTAAAKAAGMDLADIAFEPLGSLAKLGIPGTDIGVHLGTGKRAKQLATGIDRVAGWMGQSAPGRFGKMLFDPSVMGQYTRVGQEAAQEVYRARQAAAPRSIKATMAVVEPLRRARASFEEAFGKEVRQQAIDQFGVQRAEDMPGDVLEGMVTSVFDRFFRMVRETKGDVKTAMETFNLNRRNMPKELREQVRVLQRDMRKAAREVYKSGRNKGGKGGILESLAADEAAPAMGHVERQARGKGVWERVGQMFQTRPGHTFSRAEEVSNIPQEIIERMLADSHLREAEPDDAVASLLNDYGEWLGRGTTMNHKGEKIPRWESALDHAEALYGWLKGHSGPLYETNNLKTFERYMRSAVTADVTYDAIHELVQRNMLERPGNVDLTRAIGQWNNEPLVFLDDLYKRADMDSKRSLQYLSDLTGKAVDELKGMAVPLEMANAIASSRKFQSDPQWFGVVGEVIDLANSIFKQAVTLPFPSFWARNATSGQYMNLVASGEIQNFGDLTAYSQKLQSAGAMIKAGKLDPRLEAQLLENKVIGGGTVMEGVDLPGSFAMISNPENPLNVPRSWQQAGQAIAENPSMVDRVPGARAARQGYQTLLNTGAKASLNVEFMNRVPMYLYLTEHKGWSPAAAAKKVQELQVDYSKANFSPFENQVATRLIPFYKFQKAIAPVILQTLAERPGGVMAQTVRAANRSSSADATTPDYVRETLSIPNPLSGSKPDGTQSYWAGFGLPFEQHAQYVGTPREIGRELLSQAAPWLKAPLEWSTNQSFFQRGPAGAGRPLDELDPTVGRTISNLFGMEDPVQLPQALEFGLANSPASRFLTSARQASDPRKTAVDKILNAFTGVRVTDVSPGAQDAVLRERAMEMMRDMDAAQFTRVYFRPEEKAAMSPQARAKAEALELLMSQLAQRAKDRKVKKAAAAVD